MFYKLFERLLSGLGFGIGMSLSFRLMEKIDKGINFSK